MVYMMDDIKGFYWPYDRMMKVGGGMQYSILHVCGGGHFMGYTRVGLA